MFLLSAELQLNCHNDLQTIMQASCNFFSPNSSQTSEIEKATGQSLLAPKLLKEHIARLFILAISSDTISKGFIQCG